MFNIRMPKLNDVYGFSSSRAVDKIWFFDKNFRLFFFSIELDPISNFDYHIKVINVLKCFMVFDPNQEKFNGTFIFRWIGSSLTFLEYDRRILSRFVFCILHSFFTAYALIQKYKQIK